MKTDIEILNTCKNKTIHFLIYQKKRFKALKMRTYLDYKFMDFGEIIKALKMLNFDINRLSSNKEMLHYQINFISSTMLMRKSVDYMAGLDLDNPRVIAQVIIDAYPKESLSSIKRKAEYALTIEDACDCLEFDKDEKIIETKESKARDGLLAYADCMSFK